MSKLRYITDRQHLVIRSATGSEVASEYSFGIEEEYFLADAKTLDVAMETPNGLFQAANWSTGGQAMREMLQAQLEVATNIHQDIHDAREELKFLRREVASAAAEYGLVIMACSTHPTAQWHQSQLTPKPRYEAMIEDLQDVGYRNMLCGMHVHVHLPDPRKRFSTKMAMIPYIPLFIALSASSPFWHSRDTGLKGYRLAAYDEMPRAGIPELFASKQEYDRYVKALVDSGVIPDESYIWWSLRSSARHPTLELRAPDVCTSVDDAIAIASLYRALACHLYRNLAPANEIDSVDRALAVENKWRAQRYGTSCVFASKNGPVDIADLLASVIKKAEPEAAMLGCAGELSACQRIIKNGSSADTQLRIYREADGDISKVSRWIAAATVEQAQQPDQLIAQAG